MCNVSKIWRSGKLNKVARLLNDDSGATAIEYGLIVAATGLALVAVMPSIKSKISATFTEVASKMGSY